MVERPLIPTDIEFDTKDELNTFLAYDLKAWKETEMATPYFGYGYEENGLEVTFLQIY
jgi:hypothetical protein